MKKALKIVAIAIPALLILAVLFQIVIFFTLPDMKDGVIYKGSAYVPLSGHYGTTRDETVDKPVGRLSDAVVYTLKNDPEEFYLYPRVFLPHMKYVFFGRQDALPSPESGNIDRIVLWLSHDYKTSAESAARSVEITGEAKADILSALAGKNAVLTDNWADDPNAETYELLLSFNAPEGLYYLTQAVKFGDAYGILLEDGKTLAAIDGGFLSGQE